MACLVISNGVGVQLGVELRGAAAIHNDGEARREGAREVALSAGCNAARAATRFLPHGGTVGYG